ncbi:MAG: GNAT family N-acetyltransferase [Saprospiraceae bacterium]|nr:GNAT family N-acetyltransferase [Saprospiraceae bacterium]
MEIRRVSVTDLQQLQIIARSTFAESFAYGNSEDNMSKYLETEFSTDKLRTEIENKHSEFYFAVTDGNIVGYLKINTGPAQTEVQKAPTLEIERIYVLKAYHGKQVGRRLFETALERGRALGVDYLWLGVWEHNPRAIRFYEKNGFVVFDKHVFKLGEEEQTDLMMKLELEKDPAREV